MDHQDQRLQLVLDNLPVLVAFLNTEQCYEFANRQHYSWFGIEPDSVTGRHFSEVTGKDAYAMLKPCLEEALGGQKSNFLGEITFASGGKRYLHTTAIPLSSDTETIAGILVLATDLTEYKLMENELDATMLRGQTVLDTTVDGIITIDEKGTIQSCNTRAQKLFNYSEKELLGKNVRMLMSTPHAEQHDGYLQRYLETGEKRIIGIGREVTGRRKDGTEFPMELVVGEFMENGRHYFTGFTRDITDRKKAEWEARSRLNELAQVSRLSTIHNLASGISHEINQPLTAIVTMAQALLRTQQQAGKIDQALMESTLEKIVRQGVRASNIIQQMREFIGKDKVVELAPHDINNIISEVLELLEHEIKVHNIRVEKQFNNDNIPITVNRVQVEQVILNLIKNAIEAMNDVEADRILRVRTFAARNDFPFVEVSIEDNGNGLPEQPERVFDSFFTTKINGMGQGLSISHSIIDAHGGNISARPNHGRGAIFSFTLPIEQPSDN